ncbi:adenylyltransferase/cytidyltransferase family protein [Halobacteriovorax marinus]|nr:adenylyltransferase/cytidyltransferase family protein [Halobacteriovorax marinus]
MKKEVVGYTTGVFDLFHVGHVNLLRNAKSMCDKLIVGVSVDELVSYKNKTSVIKYPERAEIVRSVRYVDLVVPQIDMNKLDAWEKYKFDIMFVGSDWQNTDKWNEIEKALGEKGVRVIYFPYTRGVSSTLINEILKERREDK